MVSWNRYGPYPNNAFVLTANGIYAINRAAYSEATQIANQLTNERKKLDKELSAMVCRISKVQMESPVRN